MQGACRPVWGGLLYASFHFPKPLSCPLCLSLSLSLFLPLPLSLSLFFSHLSLPLSGSLSLSLSLALTPSTTGKPRLLFFRRLTWFQAVLEHRTPSLQIGFFFTFKYLGVLTCTSPSNMPLTEHGTAKLVLIRHAWENTLLVPFLPWPKTRLRVTGSKLTVNK